MFRIFPPEGNFAIDAFRIKKRQQSKTNIPYDIFSHFCIFSKMKKENMCEISSYIQKTTLNTINALKIKIIKQNTPTINTYIPNKSKMFQKKQKKQTTGTKSPCWFVCFIIYQIPIIHILYMLYILHIIYMSDALYSLTSGYYYIFMWARFRTEHFLVQSFNFFHKNYKNS